MHFRFSEEQLAFRDAVRALLDDACPPSAVRATWAPAHRGYDPKLWEQLGEMGVLGMLAPLDAGGLGMDEVDLVLCLEETGRAALPGPIVEHAAVAVPLLASAGSALTAAAVAGEVSVTFSQRASRVGWGAVADAIVLADDGGLRLVQGAPSVPLESVDGSRRDVAVRAPAGTALEGDAALAFDRAVLGAAAQECGLAARMIAMTVEYTGARRQFGVPVGSYQALKHHLANALLLVEHARPAVYRAAWSVARGAPARARDVSMAKVLADRAAGVAARAALQCHGAIGYTWEHDLHLWMKRAWALERVWGTTAAHRARVADAVVSPS
ncbi:MAG TPA: acyl-CoA dehydrogenase family protein [Acidimicrobiales bacterium]|nr:acyl-CoA dehydrogenase family protein [Acidimicrobiales bacterium]